MRWGLPAAVVAACVGYLIYSASGGATEYYMTVSELQAHATAVGKVLLSGVADERLEAWLGWHALERYTPHTITAPAALLEELARIRRAGYLPIISEGKAGVNSREL